MRKTNSRCRYYLVYFVLLILFWGKQIILADQNIDIPPFSDEAVLEINGGIPFLTVEESQNFPEQYYGELDSLGRCTGAFAKIGPETIPDNSRETIAEIEPTGWQTIRLEDGKYLYHRCHLIGYQLTGQNAMDRNLITGTAYLNTVLMRPYENSIYQYVTGTEKHVLYRVTPLFEGDNLLATGVLLEGCSIEDERIQFCVFCYNIQPDVDIDYATGLTKTESNFFTLIPASDIEEQEPAIVRFLDNEEEEEPDYIANKNTRKFHYPYCDSVSGMKDKNKWEFYGTRNELIEKGYVPCKRCNP